MNKRIAIKTKMKPKKAYIPDPAIKGKTTTKPVSTSPEKTPTAKKNNSNY